MTDIVMGPSAPKQMPAQEEAEINYRVSIYPDGVQPFKSKVPEFPTHVNFRNAEVKTKYVHDEYHFCMTEFSEYDGAVRKGDRFKAREKLEQKRITFAMAQGYGPNAQNGKLINKTEWFFQGKTEPTEVA